MGIDFWFDFLFFFSQPCKHALLLVWFLMRVGYSFYSFLLQVFFFFIKVFSMFSVFKRLYMMCLGLGLSVFLVFSLYWYFSCLLFSEFLVSDLVSVISWKCSAIIPLSNFFALFSPFSSFCDSDLCVCSVILFYLTTLRSIVWLFLYFCSLCIFEI